MNPPNATPMLERVLALLPENGMRVHYGAIIKRAHEELHLSAGLAGAEIALLCSSKRAAAEQVGGYQMLRRLPVLTDFPLRARPYRPPPRRPGSRARGPRPEARAR